MGTFDISRINFDAKKHYTSVRMQQGRVLSDDDWNENERIENEIQRETNVDVIGAFGTPDDGFKINAPRVETGSGLINFDILAGTLYLGGLRLNLDSAETYRLQKDWLQQPTNLDGTPNFTQQERYDLVYIEAWQQAVSAVEDSSLFEVALGGPDTTARVRNMQRIKLASDIGFCICADAWNKQIQNWHNANLGNINKEHERITNTLLKVSFANTGLPQDLCTPSAAGGYLGAENQAIRVQLVDANHFTWGFDNASPLYRVSLAADGLTVQMLTEPKDQYHWPLSNQVVEILPWSAVLPNGEKVAEQMGHLTKVNSSYDPDTNIFTIINPISATFGKEWKNRADQNDLDDQKPSEYFYMRVWNRGDDLSSPANIPITTAPVSLGYTGLQITITGNDRVENDFWVIAARPETPDQVVPWQLTLQQGIPSHGVRRFFAPLAIIRWTKIGNQLTADIIHDCRKKFNPLTERDCCCTYTVGDGIRSKGDFNSIEEAIDNLPGEGGKICVLPGEHVANVSILNRRQIRISGCGHHSLIRPRTTNIAGPIFRIQNSQKIQIDQLTLVAMDGTAIEVTDTLISAKSSQKITVRDCEILAFIHAIKITTNENQAGDNDINILYNQIGMFDKLDGKPAIFSIADKVLIERNRIVVIPTPDLKDPNDPRNSDNLNDWDPFNPCINPLLTYTQGVSPQYQIFRSLNYVGNYSPNRSYQNDYVATGGIQIGSTSERVCIRRNEIIGGNGNGITLGHLNDSYSALYEICIEENKIFQMGLSGISSLQAILQNTSTPKNPYQVYIFDISIYRNLIKNCARQIPLGILNNDFAYGGIVMSDCERCLIRENRIEENGLKFGVPICGIFILNGEAIEIGTNNIINNGIPVIEGDRNTIIGNRGGIVVKMAFKTGRRNPFGNPSFDGVPAIDVYDNIVVQPNGLALYLIACGPISVVSNQFTSYDNDNTDEISQWVSTVLIANFGVSKDFAPYNFQDLKKTKPISDSKEEYNQALRKLQYWPNGKVMFVANQTILDMKSALKTSCLSSQLIFSLDDIAFNSNQSECAGYISISNPSNGSTFDTVLLNTLLLAFSVRSNDNRFTDGVTETIYSLISMGVIATATGNQCTNCILVGGSFMTVNNENIILFRDSELCDNSGRG